MIYSRHMVLLINDTETYVETCVSFKLSKLLNKEHVEVFTQTIHFLPKYSCWSCRRAQYLNRVRIPLSCNRPFDSLSIGADTEADKVMMFIVFNKSLFTRHLLRNCRITPEWRRNTH
jgi:hypothetical protein